jgi:hypothetical protein
MTKNCVTGLVITSDLREWLFHSGVGKSTELVSGVEAKNIFGVTSGEDIIFRSDFGSGLFIVYILPSLQIVLPCNIIPQEKT